MATPPQAVIIAGPNGSGKSTAAMALLPPNMTFLNADEIAQELTGKPGTSADINAGRILLDKIDELEVEKGDFAFETTLATKTLADRVRSWRRTGYEVHLVFFLLGSADLAVQRVAQRVRLGGHDVPEPTIRRRYRAGIRNFLMLYRPLVSTWRAYDNSSGSAPLLLARSAASGVVRVECPRLWDKLLLEHNG